MNQKDLAQVIDKKYELFQKDLNGWIARGLSTGSTEENMKCAFRWGFFGGRESRQWEFMNMTNNIVGDNQPGQWPAS